MKLAQHLLYHFNYLIIVISTLSINKPNVDNGPCYLNKVLIGSWFVQKVKELFKFTKLLRSKMSRCDAI